MIKQQEYFGFGSIKNLENILKKEKSKNIFLITGKKSFEFCGAKKALDKILKNYNVFKFDNFSTNPQINSIKQGYSSFKKFNYDTILAVGGGSSIDIGKAIKMFYYNESKKKTPLITIPTTAGSGSEATYFIVYYDKKEKQSEGVHNLTLPNYVICDPQFTMNIPKNIAASSGMDALSQAIESYWSINSTPKSKKFAEKSIKLLIGNLEAAIKTKSLISKTNVMKGANLAGKAINITKTTACHSISYPITSCFNIPHGHAVSLTLGEMLEYNFNVNKADCLDLRGTGYVKKTIQELINLIGGGTLKGAKNRIKNLMDNIGLETKLSELNINKEDINIIIEKGFNPKRVENNPKKLNREDLRIILKNII